MGAERQSMIEIAGQMAVGIVVAMAQSGEERALSSVLEMPS